MGNSYGLANIKITNNYVGSMILEALKDASIGKGIVIPFTHCLQFHAIYYNREWNYFFPECYFRDNRIYIQISYSGRITLIASKDQIGFKLVARKGITLNEFINASIERERLVDRSLERFSSIKDSRIYKLCRSALMERFIRLSGELRRTFHFGQKMVIYGFESTDLGGKVLVGFDDYDRLKTDEARIFYILKYRLFYIL